ncbi:phage antirepressor KilAC domain-containing protein [Mammaliicoccus sciuri]|uniref:phage antirepressor KilAC domain-containing protein n=1 Tax=Mammaliicoccus sciuri TaxID=1296 RepID=UPI0034DDC25C
MSAVTFNQLLHQLGIQYKQGGIWLLYAKHQNKNYTKTETFSINSGDISIITKWTQSGRLFLYEFLKARGVLPLIEQEDYSA